MTWAQAGGAVADDDAPATLSALLLDPSLFTPAYDAGLSGGLRQAGVRPLWLTRPLREREEAELDPAECEAAFYRRVEAIAPARRRLRAVAKGASHLVDLAALLRRLGRNEADVVHLQWAVLPAFDAAAILAMRRHCPVVMTVHDTVPFNGERISLLQNKGFDLPLRAADRLIVHTRAALDTLRARGLDAHKIHLIPHGPLPLKAEPSVAALARARSKRFTLVLFGQIKPYKGVDLLIEALGQMPAHEREQGRVIVAGAPMMDIAPLMARAEALGLGPALEFRLGRLDHQAMADLFHEADGFVFPYRQIDASGVYFLLKPLGKWMVASRVGIFAEDLREGADGALVAAGDVHALSEAMAEAFTRRPAPPPRPNSESWAAIGAATRRLYDEAIAERSRRA
ncbi:glycosyltransferase [Aureimonas sp. N4]|uniref:glycosyltransferase n=1 Tax=Aureimonas sp. N4 TaxID=1638165 RepID=UPI000784EFAD|nr:glycosyltransferase [Aureimonas sp. N4]